MKKAAYAFGILVTMLGAMMGLGLAISFLRATFKWDLSPWWFWPVGVGTSVAVVFVGQLLMFASEYKEIKSDPHYLDSPPSRFHQDEPLREAGRSNKPYRWGKIQGIVTLLYGLSILIPGLTAGNRVVGGLGVMCIVGGFGLFTKRKYGVALLYATLALFLLIGTVAVLGHMLPRSPSFCAMASAFFLYWFIPALFYYPKRWYDFR
jgi:hypothetical protein